MCWPADPSAVAPTVLRKPFPLAQDPGVPRVELQRPVQVRQRLVPAARLPWAQAYSGHRATARSSSAARPTKSARLHSAAICWRERGGAGWLRA